MDVFCVEEKKIFFLSTLECRAIPYLHPSGPPSRCGSCLPLPNPLFFDRLRARALSAACSARNAYSAVEMPTCLSVPIFGGTYFLDSRRRQMAFTRLFPGDAPRASQIPRFALHSVAEVHNYFLSNSPINQCSIDYRLIFFHLTFEIDYLEKR